MVVNCKQKRPSVYSLNVMRLRSLVVNCEQKWPLVYSLNVTKLRSLVVNCEQKWPLVYSLNIMRLRSLLVKCEQKWPSVCLVYSFICQVDIHGGELLTEMVVSDSAVQLELRG